jgi:hypothetical protein
MFKLCVIACSALVLGACATVPPVAAPSPPPPPAPSKPAEGHIELSQALCRNGVFGFHFKTDGPAEGNAYFRLLQLAMLCRQGQSEDDDAPQPQRDDRPLPKGVERL